MKNRRWILFIVICLFSSLFFFKDALLYRIFEEGFKDHSLVFSAKKCVVWPNFLEVKGLELKTMPRASSPFFLKGADAVFKVAPVLACKRSLLAVREAHMTLTGLQAGSFSLDRFNFDLVPHANAAYADARFSIDTLSFQEKKITKGEGVLAVYPDHVLLQEVKFQGLDGNIVSSGRADFQDGAIRLDMKVRFENIEIGELMRVLGMEKRVDAAGLFTGDILLVSKGGWLESLGGELKSVRGGKFIILDTSLMDKSIASGPAQKGRTDPFQLGSGPAANIVIENLKNYYYDIGYINLQNEQQNIKINIRLEGRAGSRQLDVVWHGGVS
jgi:hypothetical protein